MSRSQSTAPFGKLTEELRVGIDELTRDSLTALAFAADKPLAEYIREALYELVYGKADRLRARMKP